MDSLQRLLFYTYSVSRYRFYIFLISFLAGVATATLMTISLALSTWLCLVALGVMVVCGRRSEAPSTAVLVTVSFALLFFALGTVRFEIASWQFGHSALTDYVGKEVQLQGEVVREPDIREDTVQLYVAVQDDLLLVTADRYTSVSYGDTVSIQGKLKTPEAFTTELGRTFNYPAYLLVRGVEYQVAFAEVSVLNSGDGFWLLEKLFLLKRSLINSIELVLQEPYAGLGEGLLLGAKQALGEDIESAFRTSGIIHIVVLSGYNVMLVVTFILFLLSFFFTKRTRILFGVVAIILFALLVGLSATVVRASIMAGILLFAEWLGRQYSLSRALLFAGVVMVFINPYLLVYDIGFQLSFMATLGLILVAPTFETFLTDGFSKLKIKDFLVSTLATQVAVLPLLIYHIGEVSLVAVIVNLLVLPVVPAAMLATFLTGIIAFVSVPFASLIGLCAYVTLRYIIEVAVFFAGVPAASLRLPEVASWTVAVMYSGLAAGLYYLKLRIKNTSIVADWVIEEEKEKAGEERSPSPAHHNPPIFFR